MIRRNILYTLVLCIAAITAYLFAFSNTETHDVVSSKPDQEKRDDHVTKEPQAIEQPEKSVESEGSFDTVAATNPQPDANHKNEPESEAVGPFPEIEDIVIGYEDSKIALVEYSSINCTHCAAFHSVFSKQFNEQFIKTHKAQHIFKHFPLDYTAVEYMSLIVKQPKEKWLPLFEKALATQKEWIGKKPQVLAKILGISEQDCKTALACKQTKQMIMAKRFNAEQVVEINATPTFLIIYRQNGELKFDLINDGISPDALLARLTQIYKEIS